MWYVHIWNGGLGREIAACETQSEAEAFAAEWSMTEGDTTVILKFCS